MRLFWSTLLASLWLFCSVSANIQALGDEVFTIYQMYKIERDVEPNARARRFGKKCATQANVCTLAEFIQDIFPKTVLTGGVTGKGYTPSDDEKTTTCTRDKMSGFDTVVQSYKTKMDNDPTGKIQTPGFVENKANNGMKGSFTQSQFQQKNNDRFRELLATGNVKTESARAVRDSAQRVLDIRGGFQKTQISIGDALSEYIGEDNKKYLAGDQANSRWYNWDQTLSNVDNDSNLSPEAKQQIKDKISKFSQHLQAASTSTDAGAVKHIGLLNRYQININSINAHLKNAGSADKIPVSAELTQKCSAWNAVTRRSSRPLGQGVRRIAQGVMSNAKLQRSRLILSIRRSEL